jgi:urease accessory protein
MLKLMSRPISSFGLLAGSLLPAAAMAHPGGEAHSFLAGAVHPLGGLDHLLAMLAVGLLAGYSGGTMRWWLPASFLTALAIGAGMGAIGVDFPFIEVGIAFSLVVFGAALVSKQSLRAPMLIALTAGFALFHGHAHGTEMGSDLSAMSYAAGFMLVTALLHVVGVLLTTKTLLPLPQATVLEWSGSAIAAVGVVSLGILL